MLSVSEIIKTHRGQSITAYYKAHENLDKKYRGVLTDIIIEKIIQEEILPSPTYFSKIAEDIVTLFPTEVIVSLFIILNLF